MAPSSPSAPEDMPFALLLPATSFIAGSIVTGSIVLDLARAQDIALTSVRIKLRGTTQTSVFASLLVGRCECALTYAQNHHARSASWPKDARAARMQGK
jgi:hypothetical protein